MQILLRKAAHICSYSRKALLCPESLAKIINLLKQSGQKQESQGAEHKPSSPFCLKPSHPLKRFCNSLLWHLVVAGYVCISNIHIYKIMLLLIFKNGKIDIELQNDSWITWEQSRKPVSCLLSLIWKLYSLEFLGRLYKRGWTDISNPWRGPLLCNIHHGA